MPEWLSHNPVLLGFLASLAAGLATGVGALPILFLRRFSERVMDTLLGFAAGVMLAATVFSLIVPAIAAGGVWRTILGLVLGGLLLEVADHVLPHTHLEPGGNTEGPKSSLRKTWLFAIAITIHNLPEGLSVGVGFGSGNLHAGLILALAIGFQNMPEGLAVALPLLREGYSRPRALFYAALTGLVEAPMGLLGAALVVWTAPLLPYALAFAAGAMLYVISDEIIPETHRRGFEREATWGLIAGFCLMLVLDNIFG
jgi:ZIP family zinc transporter